MTVVFVSFFEVKKSNIFFNFIKVVSKKMILWKTFLKHNQFQIKKSERPLIIKTKIKKM